MVVCPPPLSTLLSETGEEAACLTEGNMPCNCDGTVHQTEYCRGVTDRDHSLASAML